MSANSWIILGVIATAVAGFSLPYGFYLKSHEKNNSSENHTTIKTQIYNPSIKGDVVGGDKIVNQNIITHNNPIESNEVISQKSIDLSLNSIRIYLIEIAENMYQIGLICEIANLDQRAHLVRHVNFNGDAFDIVPRAPIHFKKAFLQEEIIEGQIIGDNFVAPNKDKFFKVLLPLKVEMVIKYQPPEIIFWGEWEINIEVSV